MSKVEDIEKQISALPPGDLAELRAWFETFDADLFDEKIGRDARSGNLDRIAEQSLAELKAGRVRNL